ncbi:MAG TPA: zf-TFIIB domain-containing protein [Vulgatibacter sp.]|nr:zf-TFIIB domain-containing protein [Vulgatibacter sp.]
MAEKLSNEEEYFARENAEKLRKLALERSRELAQAQKEEMKRLHWMRCPKCGMELQTVEFRGVDIDRCFSCGATVFDAGELEKLGVTEEKSGAIMKSILNIFR